MPVGERLRRARLERGLSLEQVSKHTKVQPWILDAIERDDLSRIPGGVFIRGYLTSFARATGLDPIDIVTEHFGAPPVPTEPAPPPQVVEPPQPTGTPLWQMAVIVAAVITVVVMWRGAARHDGRPGAAPSAAFAAHAASLRTVKPPEPPPTPVPAATATTGVVAAATPGDTERIPDSTSKPVSLANAPLVVALHATGEAWIEATVDGERKTYRLFTQGETLRLDAQKEVRLLVGDASAVTYTVNGKPAPPLGGPGIVRSVVIPADNVSAPGTSHAVTEVAGRDGAQPAAGVAPPAPTVASGAISEPTPDVHDSNGKETPASDAGAPDPGR